MKGKLDLDFVLFDMIGTTVQDTGSGKSVILESFKSAFQKHGIEVAYGTINEQRGKSKRKAIRSILTDMKLDVNNFQEPIYDEFMNALQKTITHFREMPGASQAFETLQSKGIKIGIGSGLPLQFINQLLEHLYWNPNDFDYINSSEELKEGRPHPAMILDAIEVLRLSDKKRILKIGDTAVDVMEGQNAEVLTAMVLTGTQAVVHLNDNKPDFIWESVLGLIELV